jgi:hypothetical protein
MRAIFLGTRASYECGMPLVWEFTTVLRDNVLRRLDSRLFDFRKRVAVVVAPEVGRQPQISRNRHRAGAGGHCNCLRILVVERGVSNPRTRRYEYRGLSVRS